ncbi:MAG: ankyrin repeat domain-containing protein [Elusimicrobia bacterium]|nr:ankyrin repeat domain-containing protein [Elusimicrobiota bacterium]
MDDLDGPACLRLNGRPRVAAALFAAAGLFWGSACLEALDRERVPPLQDSVRHREVDVIRKLLASGADVNERGPGGFTAIDLAVDEFHGGKDMIRILVEAGAKQSLLTAMYLEDDAGVRRRIAAKEDLEPRTAYGKTPLHLAAHLGRVRAAEALLDAGAPIDPVDRFNRTPLSWSMQGDDAVSRLFIERGAALGQLDSLHQAPLYYAASYGKTEIVKLLLAKGADANLAGQQGFSPLQMAAQYGRAEIVELLLQAGADLNAVDMRGQTALDHAVKGNQPRLAARLQKAGAKPGAPEAPPPQPPAHVSPPAAQTVSPRREALRPGDIALTEPCVIGVPRTAYFGSCRFTGHHRSPVRLAWKPVPGAVRYEVQMGLTRCESPVYSPAAVFTREVLEPILEAALDPSKPDELYAVHVKAYDAIGAVVGRLRFPSGQAYDFRVPDSKGRYTPDPKCYDKLYRWHAPKSEQIRRPEPYAD